MLVVFRTGHDLKGNLRHSHLLDTFVIMGIDGILEIQLAPVINTGTGRGQQLLRKLVTLGNVSKIEGHVHGNQRIVIESQDAVILMIPRNNISRPCIRDLSI